MQTPVYEARAPAKVILFGEYSILRGHPALAAGIDLHTSCRAYSANDNQWMVNRHPISERYDLYIMRAVEILGGEPLHLSTRSRVPSASGLGSSASITAASTASILAARSVFSQEDCFRTAHKAESMAEKREASPLDTSCVCFGGFILANGRRCGLAETGELISKETEKAGEWDLQKIPSLDINIVIGFTGIKGRTREVVKSFSAFTTHQSIFSTEIINDIGRVSKKGIEAMLDGDLATAGQMMAKSHKLLATLGVNTPEIQRLVDAANRHSLGSKVTGSGGGGCMVALTEDPQETAEAIDRAGGFSILANIDDEGVVVKTL